VSDPGLALGTACFIVSIELVTSLPRGQ
jgi:hypothetical protein